MTKRIAVIGTGISGLTSAYSISGKHAITVFEAENHIGGHTHTANVDFNGEKAAIDTGFIVFNDRTYPNFMQLLSDLKVKYQPTEMSFSVRNDSVDLEYNGHTLLSMFSQRKNIVRPSFYRMLFDIVRFNKAVRRPDNADRTIGDFLQKEGYSTIFKDNYLLPMVSAIWSMGMDSCMDFPLQFFARFFENHGLLDLTNRPQWFTIIGGSSTYLKPLTHGFSNKIHTNTAVKRVTREKNVVRVETAEDSAEFDEVIFACHGDQALAILANPAPEERKILQNFKFSSNSVVLHTDTSLLPRGKSSWASWNYSVIDAGKEMTTLTYNMNILQCLNLNNTYLVSLNQHVDEQFVIKKYSYSHPIYSLDAIESQSKWQEISGKDRIHYCGAYWFNGFHEDGVRSGLRVAEAMEAKR